MKIEDMPRPSHRSIREMRELLGVSERELGERLGVSQESVSGYQKREKLGSLSIGKLVRVADAMDCDLFYCLVRRKK